MFFLFIFVPCELVIIKNKNMTEKAEKYRAISQLAELLRESTKKRLVLDENMEPEVEYFNVDRKSVV